MAPFTFSQPTTTGASSGSLFGTTAGTNAGSGGLFGGGGTGTTGGSTSFSFGATPATTKPSTPSLFGGGGASSTTNTTSDGAPTSLFGKPGGAATFSFGAPSSDKPAEEQPKPSIFGTNLSQPPATPGSSAPSLFGSTTPAGTSSTGNLQPSTTPAGAPPQPAAFGASTGGAGLFGQLSKDSSKQPTFSFGKPADTASPAAQPANSTQSAPKASFSFATPAAATTTTREDSTPSLFGAAPVAGMLSTTTTAPSAATSSQAASSPFGAPPALPSQPASSGGLFGKPASAAPSTSSLFGQPSKPATTDTAPKPAFSFPAITSSSGAPANQTSTAPPTTTQAPLFGPPAPAAGTSSAPSTLFKLPATTSATSGTAATTGTSTPAGGLFSLGGSSAPSAAATTTTTTTNPSTTASSGGLFSLGGTTTAAAAAPATSTPAGGLFSLGGTTTAATTSGNTTTSAPPAASSTAPSGLGGSVLGASTSGPTPPVQSRLRNKTLDEILTRWATDLTRYTKDFKSQAETIAHWDQIIVDNSSKIDKLYIKTRTCEKQTMGVEMQLAAVENQQNELEAWLSKYENDVEEMLAKEGPAQTELGGPDQERERTYKLAEKLGERLEDMGRDLESMVEQVNAANASLSKHTTADEPITQIVRILNSHLTQLQQIDQGSAALQAKVAAAHKSASHLGYLNGNGNSEGRAAVDDFYRSYMGRR